MSHPPLPTFSSHTPVILVVAGCAQERDLEADRTAEMVNLLDTGGRKVLAVVTQHLARPAAGTFIGSGKIEEVKAAKAEHGAVEVAMDVRLSPRQQRNLEEALECDVIDYDELILDIFARGARTHQAMLAVELARMQYLKGRLRRLWTHLDRQSSGGSAGGGSGFKSGTGEKQIEMDRRLVKSRIQDLKDRLKAIATRTERVAAGRSEAFNVALVGYTNAGKSTVMNALTPAGVLAEDRLFATLDTRTSRLRLHEARNVVLSDTVGFIRNLPHTLIASFHATLTEVREADLLLHIVDGSSPVMDQQIEAVESVLETIGADVVPRITVLNKCDAAPSRPVLSAVKRRYDRAVVISARNGEGLDALRDMISTEANRATQLAEVRYSGADGATDAKVRREAVVVGEQYDGDQVVLTIRAGEDLLGELRGRSGVVVAEPQAKKAVNPPGKGRKRSNPTT
jgi:GTP-binding protein HflX